MLKWVADLHIHTLLSPCAAVEMTPRHIVLKAAAHGVNLIAITDHNVSANVLPAVRLGQEHGVAVWPGMEVETREGGHMVVLFDSLRKMLAFQKLLDENMSGLKNNPERFGGQFVVDENDRFVREEERLLLAAVNLDAGALAAYAARLGGVCVASHIDRPAYSLLTYFGFIPPGLGLAAVELSGAGLRAGGEQKYAALTGGLPCITNSDAHVMDDFLGGPKNHIYMKEPVIGEFKLALAAAGGRMVAAGKFL
ncbi:MAG: PHP domain-containing protein [Acidaminococcales bacterium]|jgi:PHP family Zn ribbon phosphoesterase|nr:PHP domain-containing protein [Acidaminococcales bacterium]